MRSRTRRKTGCTLKAPKGILKVPSRRLPSRPTVSSSTDAPGFTRDAGCRRFGGIVADGRERERAGEIEGEGEQWKNSMDGRWTAEEGSPWKNTLIARSDIVPLRLLAGSKRWPWMPPLLLPTPFSFPLFLSTRTVDGRRVLFFFSRFAVFLPSTPRSSSFKQLKKTTIANNDSQKNRVITSRIEGRSYPPLYRAHKWAKGGWTHLRPSPFGI